MTEEADALTPEQKEELREYWNQQESAKEEARRLTWSSFLEWLQRQTELLKRNPGLLESITQMGPALLTQILRILT